MSTKLISKSMAVVTAVLITAVLAIYSQQAFGKDDPNAQSPKGPGDMRERVEKRMEHLTKELNLTKEQQEKIRPIIEKEMKDIRDVRQDTSLTQEQKMEKIKVIHQATQAELNKILTPEQQKKYAEMQEKAREEMAERRAEHSKNHQHEQGDSNSK
jgi:periplasmic protein CpxP/Spy